MQHRNIPAGLRHHSHLRANMDFTQVFSKTGISEMSSPLPTSCLQHPPTPARCSRSIRRRYLRGFKVTSTGNGPKADPTDPFKHHKTVKHGWLMLTILVGGWATPLKNISQLGWLFPIYWKKRNVPNHQSADYRSILILWKWDPIWSSVPPCLVWWSWTKLITCPRSVKWSCSHSPADRPKNPSRIHGRNITAIESLCDTATHAWICLGGIKGISRGLSDPDPLWRAHKGCCYQHGIAWSSSDDMYTVRFHNWASHQAGPTAGKFRKQITERQSLLASWPQNWTLESSYPVKNYHSAQGTPFVEQIR